MLTPTPTPHHCHPPTPSPSPHPVTPITPHLVIRSSCQPNTCFKNATATCTGTAMPTSGRHHRVDADEGGHARRPWGRLSGRGAGAGWQRSTRGCRRVRASASPSADDDAGRGAAGDAPRKAQRHDGIARLQARRTPRRHHRAGSLRRRARQVMLGIFGQYLRRQFCTVGQDDRDRPAADAAALRRRASRRFTTWAFVTISPSACQMVLAPPLRRCCAPAPGWWVTLSLTSASAPLRSARSWPSPATSAPRRRPLPARRCTHIAHRHAPADRDRRSAAPASRQPRTAPPSSVTTTSPWSRASSLPLAARLDRDEYDRSPGRVCSWRCEPHPAGCLRPCSRGMPVRQDRGNNAPPAAGWSRSHRASADDELMPPGGRPPWSGPPEKRDT